MIIIEILFWIFIIFTFLYIIGLIRIMFYERSINKLYKEKNKKIEEIKHRPGQDLVFMNGSIKQIEDECKPKIEELERKRRFVLDKLPLIKK